MESNYYNLGRARSLKLVHLSVSGSEIVPRFMDDVYKSQCEKLALSATNKIVEKGPACCAVKRWGRENRYEIISIVLFCSPMMERVDLCFE